MSYTWFRASSKTWCRSKAKSGSVQSYSQVASADYAQGPRRNRSLARMGAGAPGFLTSWRDRNSCNYFAAKTKNLPVTIGESQGGRPDGVVRVVALQEDVTITQHMSTINDEAHVCPEALGCSGEGELHPMPRLSATYSFVYHEATYSCSKTLKASVFSSSECSTD